jgi:hypothetical protein
MNLSLPSLLVFKDQQMGASLRYGWRCKNHQAWSHADVICQNSALILHKAAYRDALDSSEYL